MRRAAFTQSSNTTEVANLSTAELAALVQSQAVTIDALKHQLEWFKRQVFGAKSERYAPQPDPSQMHLGETFPVPAQLTEQHKDVPAHTRRVSKTDMAGEADAVPFFDESRVPVQTIELPNPEIEGLAADQYKVIDQKISYRLGQRPGSYVVLKYVRPVVKRLDTQTIHCPSGLQVGLLWTYSGSSAPGSGV